MMGNLTDAERTRFASKYDVQRGTGCWVWRGPLDRDGYGTFHLRRLTRRAHRVGWYDLRGPIPEGMVVNHACRNRRCVNPQHMELTTPRENALRDTTSVAAINGRKTHCPRGHEYDRQYGSRRSCSICEKAKKKRLRAKWQAEDTLAV